jgi:hypothetical protein
MRHEPVKARTTLPLILLPMLGTVISQRLYLHLVPIKHVYVVGYLVHHLFWGLLIVLPAAFTFAFGVRKRLLAFVVLVVLGIGSGMILDEVIYLIATDGTSADYRTPVSLWGSIILNSLATGILLMLYQIHRGES